jgi:hypothetical protein
VRVEWSEAEAMVWHTQHLEQDSSSSEEDEGFDSVPASLLGGGSPTGAADALSMLAAMAAQLGILPSAMTAAAWLARFQANNFSLSLRGQEQAAEESAADTVAPSPPPPPVPLVVGGAVCPRTAILNHACAPNCRLETLALPPPAAFGTYVRSRN